MYHMMPDPRAGQRITRKNGYGSPGDRPGETPGEPPGESQNL